MGEERPTVRAAASVVLVREDGQVLWVRRGAQLRFAGGFYAFPGGAVDLEDAAADLLYADALDAAEAPCVAAAARELFEETGVLAVPGAAAVPAGERAAVRRELLRRPAPGEAKAASFNEFLARHRLRIDARQFAPAGRWVTPHALPVRFDARFYLVRMPEGEHAEIWPGELADGEFIKPEAALRRWEDGSALLHPPAWHTLRALAHAGSPAAALPLLTAPETAPWKLPMREHIVQRIEFQRGLVMVPLRTPTLPPATHTNCLLLGDDELWVVDPGSPWKEEQDVLSDTLAHLASEGRRAVGILLTHHHHDHAGGAAALREELGIPIAATAETRDLLDLRVDRLVVDGERFEVGPRGWRALHLPGHTRGHLCLIEDGSGAVVAGDLVAGVGTVIIDPPEGDMREYLASLDRLLSARPGAIYPAHGPVVPEGIARLEQYRTHRHEREARVIAALAAAPGPATPAQLVPGAYPDVKPELYPLAERSLLAHLIKLVRDGKALETPAGYQLGSR